MAIEDLTGSESGSGSGDGTGSGSRFREAMWVLALALGAILAYVVYSFIGPFVLGVFIYYITRPIHRRINHRIPTASLAAAVSLLAIALPLILLLGYTVYVGIIQLAAFAQTQNLTALSTMLEPIIENLGGSQMETGNTPQQTLASVVQNPQQFANGGTTDTAQRVLISTAGYLSFLGNAIIQLFIVLALAFYLLRDDHHLSQWFTREFATEGTAAHAYFVTVDRDLKTVFFGNILNAFAVAILGAISYGVLNVFAPTAVAIPSPILVGLLVGVGSLVPVVGMKIVYVPVALLLIIEAVVAGLAGLWFPAAFLAVSLLIVDTIPDFLLRPYVSGREMHTGTVMIAYIIGPLLFGWYGLFLGPLLLVAMVHFARIILPELARGEPITGYSSTDMSGNPSPHDGPGPVNGDSDSDVDIDEQTVTDGETPTHGSESADRTKPDEED